MSVGLGHRPDGSATGAADPLYEVASSRVALARRPSIYQTRMQSLTGLRERTDSSSSDSRGSCNCLSVVGRRAAAILTTSWPPRSLSCAQAMMGILNVSPRSGAAQSGRGLLQETTTGLNRHRI